MNTFLEQLSIHMNNLSELKWLQQLYSRIDWRIVQQFTSNADSHLNKNWPTEFLFKIDDPLTKEFAVSNPFLSWTQLINLFSHIGLEIKWSERDDIFNSFIISAVSSILALMILFFLFFLGVCAWHSCHYAALSIETYLYEGFTWFFALQTFFTAAPFFIGLLAYGIYGLKCVFFVFSLIGFALALIFTIDLAAKSETEQLKPHVARKIK